MSLIAKKIWQFKIFKIFDCIKIGIYVHGVYKREGFMFANAYIRSHKL